MRPYILVFSFILSVAAAAQQTTNSGVADTETGVFQPYIQRLTAFGKNIPQEKVFVHMDNTTYFLGDTIWLPSITTAAPPK